MDRLWLLSEALDQAVIAYPQLREQYALYKLLGVSQAIVLAGIGILLVVFTVSHQEGDNPMDKLPYFVVPALLLVVLRIVEVVYVTDVLFLLDVL